MHKYDLLVTVVSPNKDHHAILVKDLYSAGFEDLHYLGSSEIHQDERHYRYLVSGDDRSAAFLKIKYSHNLHQIKKVGP